MKKVRIWIAVAAFALTSGCAYNKQGQILVWDTATNTFIAVGMVIAAKGTVDALEDTF